MLETYREKYLETYRSSVQRAVWFCDAETLADASDSKEERARRQATRARLAHTLQWSIHTIYNTLHVVLSTYFDQSDCLSVSLF